MRNRDQYSEKSETWCGLNRPDLEESQCDAVVFGVPYDGSESARAGAAEGPDILRRNTASATACNEKLDFFDSFKIYDGGDFRGTDREVIFKEVEAYVQSLVAMDKKFTLIGGDHSVTIPALTGLSKAARSQLGIINIGAHLELCDEIEGDKFSYSSTMRRALELENVAGPENVYFIGARTIEKDEFNFLKGKNFSIKTAADCFEEGIDAVIDDCIKKMGNFEKVYVTFDIDALDPAFAAGTGTPQFGGLTARMALSLLERLFCELNVVGFDIVEIAPALDPSLTSMFAGRKLIRQAWSYWADAIGKLDKLR